MYDLLPSSTDLNSQEETVKILRRGAFFHHVHSFPMLLIIELVLPTAWDIEDKSPFIDIDSSRLKVSYTEQENKLLGYGYHDDDGYSFCSGSGEQYDLPCYEYTTGYTTGDIIGCYLNFRSNIVFYTKNAMIVSLNILYHWCGDLGKLEVATIFDGATRTGISETGAEELDDMTFGGEGPPTWPPESYWRKRTYVLELGTRGRKTIVAPNAG
ncbi:hypothetical protein C2G38_2225774 [Gigaspora rosea]|uniref:B30.2/SPRY domain-containing protein n=1 Tax=Gigaspora rosea TaxID=44941 RepID=A0A397TYX3_9GLOM|nr:hypothetical protein C2G38_2225774 [Gigaspora rosea]